MYKIINDQRAQIRLSPSYSKYFEDMINELFAKFTGNVLEIIGTEVLDNVIIKHTPKLETLIINECTFKELVIDNKYVSSVKCMKSDLELLQINNHCANSLENILPLSLSIESCDCIKSLRITGSDIYRMSIDTSTVDWFDILGNNRFFRDGTPENIFRIETTDFQKINISFMDGFNPPFIEVDQAYSQVFLAVMPGVRQIINL